MTPAQPLYQYSACLESQVLPSVCAHYTDQKNSKWQPSASYMPFQHSDSFSLLENHHLPLQTQHCHAHHHQHSHTHLPAVQTYLRKQHLHRLLGIPKTMIFALNRLFLLTVHSASEVTWVTVFKDAWRTGIKWKLLRSSKVDSRIPQKVAPISR